MRKFAMLTLLVCLILPATAHAQKPWTSDDSIVALTIPSGWRKMTGNTLEFEAQRYTTADDRWARCKVMVGTFPNVRQRTQEEINPEIDTMISPLLAGYASSGVRITYSYETVDGVRYKIARFNMQGALFEMRQGAAVRGDVVHMTHLECDVATPLTAQDTADVKSFLDSVRIGRS